MPRQLTYELLRGLAYRQISHVEMRKYTVILPIIIASIVVLIYLILPIRPHLLGKDGALLVLLSVLSTLPGFYLAGLAAVATFGNDSMDRELPKPTPSIQILTSGASVTVLLTKRQFLSYLFSYLVVISLVGCAVIFFLQLFYPSTGLLKAWLDTRLFGDVYWLLTKTAVFAAVCLLMSSLIVTTLHGIFFLTEKIHQP